MSKDNDKSLAQFCEEFGAIIHQLLNSSGKVLSAIEGSIETPRQISKEGAAEFYNKRFDLQDSVDLLCDLRAICDLRTVNIPDEEEFYNSIELLRETALDAATYLVTANAIIKDIITIYLVQHIDDINSYLYLAMLKLVSGRIHSMREELNKLYRKTSRLLPDLAVPDDHTGMEKESILPGKAESFKLLRNTLGKAFAEYAKRHESNPGTEYFTAVQQYLDAFAKGVRPDKEFGFSFALNINDNRLEYFYFNFEPEMLEVLYSGNVSDGSAGSDDYADWHYSIWLDGCEEEDNSYNFSRILELVRAGAELVIEGPEEYVVYGE